MEEACGGLGLYPHPSITEPATVKQVDLQKKTHPNNPKPDLVAGTDIFKPRVG